MKLVLVAQPRSCSTWVMNQLKTSPNLDVVRDHFGELLTPGYRHNTRKILGLGPIEEPETWSMDIDYAREFWHQHPNGCFKILAHANGAEFYNYLMGRKDVFFATIQRSNTADALASEIACMIKHRQGGDQMAFKKPAREHKVRYQDIEQFVFNTPDWKRARILEFFYYLLEGKGQRWLTQFGQHENTITNIVDRRDMDVLERVTNSSFAWDTLKMQSSYRDIFEDWEAYENDMRSILGLV